MATKVGLITKLEPLNDDQGEQQTWENDNGKFFKWLVTIDGITGSALSKEVPPWWKEKMAVKYDVTEKTFKGEKQYSFKGFKKPEPDEAKKAHISEAYKNKESSYPKSSYNDPVLLHQTAMAKSIVDIAIKFLKAINFVPPEPATVHQLADMFYEWIMKDVKDMHSFWVRRDMLTAAIESIEWFPVWYPDPADQAKKEKTTTKIFRCAEFFLTAPMAITADVLNLGKEEKK